MKEVVSEQGLLKDRLSRGKKERSGRGKRKAVNCVLLSNSVHTVHKKDFPAQKTPLEVGELKP